MNSLERTRQQLDPVGTLPARLVTIALAAGAFAFGVAMMIRDANETANWALAVLALVSLAGGSLVVVLASSPRQAPFTFISHVLVQVLALASIALAAASQWGNGSFAPDGLGAGSLGILIVAMGIYRPARELATLGALAAVFVGFITLLSAPGVTADAPAAAFVLVAMAPVLSFAFGAAAFSGQLVADLERWQRTANRSLKAAASEYEDGILAAVRQERLKILDQDVFPFFSEILSQSSVTEEDRNRAREISNSIRAVMVAEADRTWLELVASEDGMSPSALKQSVVDLDGRATGMSAEQRTALRALIVALLESAAFESGTLRFVFTGTGQVSTATMTALIRDASDKAQAGFGSYFAVMRIVFTELKVDYRNTKLTVRFSYDQR